MIAGAVLAALYALSQIVRSSADLYRYPSKTEELDKRVTHLESVTDAINTRLMSIETGQKSSTAAQEGIQRTLLELTANFKSMADTSLQTWRTGMETSEKLKNYQVYVDGRMGDMATDLGALRSQLQAQTRRANGSNISGTPIEKKP